MPASPCSLGLLWVKVTGGGGQVENWAGELMAKAPSRAGVDALVYKAPMALWPAQAGYRRHHGGVGGSAEGYGAHRAAAGAGGGE